MAGTVRYLRETYVHFDNWEPALRALYQGPPLLRPDARRHRPGPPDLNHGSDSPATIGAFVREFGFAVIKGVLSRDETTAIDTAIAGKVLQPDPTGEGSLELVVRAGPVANGVCDAANPCTILVNDAGLQDEDAFIYFPITFAP